MSYGSRLEEALTARGATREGLASAIGISVQAVGQVIAGKTKALTAENNSYAARYLRVSTDWLATGEGARDVNVLPALDEPQPGYTRLPVLAQASAGPGRLAVSDPELVQHVDVLESWVRQHLRANPERLKVLTARGHSMTGVVDDGDLMFVELCEEFEVDGIYVLSVEGLVRVKRLRLRVLDKMLSIESTDGSQPELASLADVGTRILIHGRVLASWTLKRH